MLKAIFKKSFLILNDNLETLIISNIGWFICCSPFILIQFYFIKSSKFNVVLWGLLSVVSFLFVPASTAGLFYLVYIIIKEKDAGFKDYLVGIKKYFAKSILLCIIDILIFLILTFNLLFYAKLGAEVSGIIRYFIILVMGLIIWLLFFFILSQIYIFPLMVAHKPSIFAILKKSFILVANNLFLSLIILIASVFLISLWIISGLGVVCFLGITVSLLGMITLEELAPVKIETT